MNYGDHSHCMVVSIPAKLHHHQSKATAAENSLRSIDSNQSEVWLITVAFFFFLVDT